jgi:glycosyltransferase involved in cell wall biosynthesis
VPKDTVKILEAANKLVNNNELRNNMAQRAREYYEEKFSIYSAGKSIGSLINNLHSK